MKKAILLLAAFFAATAWINAQTVYKGPVNTWFMVLGRVKMSNDWSITTELHERTGAFLDVQGQFLFRPSVDYHLNKQVELSLGYSYIRVSPYDPYSLPIPRNENNLWEQILLKSEVGNMHLQSRLRQEHRWVGHLLEEPGGYSLRGADFANRFRYRLTASLDIFPGKDGARRWFLNGFDELWINQNNHLMPTGFGRNWAYLGLGYRFNASASVQLGYMSQVDKTGPDAFIQSDIIQSSLALSF